MRREALVHQTKLYYNPPSFCLRSVATGSKPPGSGKYFENGARLNNSKQASGLIFVIPTSLFIYTS